MMNRQMTQKLNRFLNSNFCIRLIYVVAAYIIISLTVFRIRHAWMTDTELLLHLPNALVWDSVPYDEARPNGK